MRVRLVKIGNSQGVRIPKPLLDQTGIGEDVELEVSESQIILRPISNPRPGWEAGFKTMAKKGHDALIIGENTFAHSWDEEEWQWK
jgi:antitoxin MazE